MVEFTQNGIRIDGKEEPFYSGSFHYWRSDTKNWAGILENIKKMGFKIVETYVPWGIHEPQKGCFDFGEVKQENNLEHFLDLCERMDMKVVVRPGPHINAEMDCFGFPEWVVKDTEMTAKNPWGTEVVYPYITRPYAIPSYASQKFYENVHNYYKKLAPIFKRHAHPKGNIIAIQADNETCNFFRDNPYIMDYAEDSIRQYHQYLHKKYPSVALLNKTLHTAYPDYESIVAPSGLTDDNYLECREWVLFKEYQILYAIQQIVSYIMEMELNIPIFHNCAYQTYTPISVQRDEEINGLSVAGMDAYPEPYDAELLKERIRFLSGSSRLNFVPEFGSGSYFDRGLVLSAKEEEFGYFYAFMNGMKAVNYYMLVERDRWTGCPVKNNGSLRQSYFDLYKSMNHFLIKNEIWKDRRTPPILILKNYEMGRMKAMSCECGVSLLSSNALVEGPDIPDEILYHELPDEFRADTCSDRRYEVWTQMVADYLDGIHMEYDYSDMFISPEKMSRYDYVFAASYPYMAEEYQQMLAEYNGLTDKKLFIGPWIPDKDEYGNHCAKLEGICCIETKRQLQTIKLNELEQLIRLEEAGIELSVHDCAAEGKKHLYLANVTMERKAFSLSVARGYRIEGIWNNHIRQIKEHTVSMEMDPFTVSVYELWEEGL